MIEASFDCRLGEVGLQRGQFVAAGERLFEALGTAVAEIEAQIPLGQMLIRWQPSLR